MNRDVMSWLLFSDGLFKLSENKHEREDNFLPPSTKLRQGNVFTSVCQEFCPQGGEACVAGGACMAGQGLAWQGVGHGRVACMAGGGGGCGRRNGLLQRAVRILLECMLVFVTAQC